MRVTNVAELASEAWRFVADEIDRPDLEWNFYSSTPQSTLERLVRKPRLARYRAALQAANSARNATALISHMPVITAATAQAMRWSGASSRHLAISFNFTDLPTGSRLAYMRRAFRHVDRFLVYSTAEQKLYPQLFNIDPSRFDFMHWPMDRPAIDDKPLPLNTPYISAVGGEARDYHTLIEAMRELPSINLVIVTRPGMIDRQKLPPNITLFTNLPGDQFWGTVQRSEFTIVPLRDENTNCGHITIMGSMLLQCPIIATRSNGIADYTGAGRARLTEPGDPRALREAIASLWSAPVERRRLAHEGHMFASRVASVDNMRQYVSDFLAG